MLLDVRSSEEMGQRAEPVALHMPIDELPDRRPEVPADRLVAAFCSSVTRAVVAGAYLQLRGLDKARILVAGYEELTAEFKPRQVYRRKKR